MTEGGATVPAAVSRLAQGAAAVERLPWRACLAVLLIAGYFELAIVLHWWRDQLFWDSGVYARAAADMVAGRDPYRMIADPSFLPFVYHPLVLRVLSWPYLLLPQAPISAMLIAAGAAWAWLESRRVANATGARAGGIEAALVAATIGFAGVKGVVTGNLTVALHFAVFGALLCDLRRDRQFAGWRTMGIIVVAAIMKPQFLAYVLLRFLARKEDDRRNVGAVALVCAGTAAIWLTGFVFWPAEMAAYIANVLRFNDPEHLDVGFGFYALFLKAVPPAPALLLHGVLSGGIALLAWRPLRAATDGHRLLAVVGAAYLLVSLTNPRLKAYDIGPALIIFALAAWGTWARARHALTGAMLVMLVPAALAVAKAAPALRKALPGATVQAAAEPGAGRPETGESLTLAGSRPSWPVSRKILA